MKVAPAAIWCSLQLTPDLLSQNWREIFENEKKGRIGEKFLENEIIRIGGNFLRMKDGQNWKEFFENKKRLELEGIF